MRKGTWVIEGTQEGEMGMKSHLSYREDMTHLP